MAQAVEATQTYEVDHEAEHADGGHGAHPPTTTGMNHRKLVMWLFLASDCMFFGALIATYMIYRGRAEAVGAGPYPADLIDIPFTSVSAFVLLMSSLTMVLSVNSIEKNDIRGMRIWILATALLGTIFLGGQYFEFTEFYHEGLTLQGSIFGATFFTLTGFHGLHVAIGVLWLVTLLFVSLRGGIKQENNLDIEIAGLYWHFVDIVWIVIFTLVYLFPYVDPESGETATSSVLEIGQLVMGSVV